MMKTKLTLFVAAVAVALFGVGCASTVETMIEVLLPETKNVNEQQPARTLIINNWEEDPLIRSISAENIDVFTALKKICPGKDPYGDHVRQVSSGKFIRLHFNRSDIVDRSLITDRGVAMLLESVSLQNCDFHLIGHPVTDKSAALISQNKGIKYLWMGGTQITDKALESFKKMTHLHTLHLCDSRNIGDSSVTHLKDMTWLKGLWLKNTAITPGKILELQAALPNCEFFLDGNNPRKDILYPPKRGSSINKKDE